MRERCANESHKSFHNYGGRGIKVCARWVDSFATFIADMGEPPDRSYSIDRNDVNGDYEPGNCSWKTSAQQARNRRTNVFYQYQGKNLVIKDLAEASGVPEQTLYNRIRRGIKGEDLTRPGRLPRQSTCAK